MCIRDRVSDVEVMRGGAQQHQVEPEIRGDGSGDDQSAGQRKGIGMRGLRRLRVKAPAGGGQQGGETAAQIERIEDRQVRQRFHQTILGEVPDRHQTQRTPVSYTHLGICGARVSLPLAGMRLHRHDAAIGTGANINVD